MDADWFCEREGDPCRFRAELVRLRQTVSALSEQVITDELTGLYNYRHFVRALDIEMERCQRTGKAMSLLLMDIDDFKQANDRHGHEFGNRVLAHLAARIMDTVRKLDVPCRYGGEEFALILPDTSLGQALQLAERLRRQISAMRVPWGQMKMAITVSIGVDTLMAREQRDAETLIDDADTHLRQAKQDGKNRICYALDRLFADGVSVSERDALLGDPDCS